MGRIAKIDRMTKAEWEEFERRTFEELNRGKACGPKLQQDLRRIWGEREQREREILAEITKRRISPAVFLSSSSTVLPARVRLLKTGLPEISNREIKARLMKTGVYKYKKLFPFIEIQNCFYFLKEQLTKDGYKVEKFNCPPVACILLNRKDYEKLATKTFGIASKTTYEEYGFAMAKKTEIRREMARVSMGFYSILILLKRPKWEKEATSKKLRKHYFSCILHELLHLFEAYLDKPPGSLTRRYGL